MKRLTDWTPPISVILWGSFIFSAIILFISMLFNEDGFTLPWVSGVSGNLGTELLGALATYFIFDRVVRRREQQETERQRRHERLERLIRDLKSPANTTAIDAAREMRAEEFHLEPGLAGLSVDGGQLSDIPFSKFKLQEASLRHAKLDGANLTDADLTNADLTGANLTGATLKNTILVGATLDNADLTDADLNGADLTACSLRGAKLTDIKMDGTESWDDAILPDSDLFASVVWSDQVEFTQYTKPEEEPQNPFARARPGLRSN